MPCKGTFCFHPRAMPSDFPDNVKTKLQGYLCITYSAPQTPRQPAWSRIATLSSPRAICSYDSNFFRAIPVAGESLDWEHAAALATHPAQGLHRGMTQTCYLWLCATRRFMQGEPWIGGWSCLKMWPRLTEDLSHIVQIGIRTDPLRLRGSCCVQSDAVHSKAVLVRYESEQQPSDQKQPFHTKKENGQGDAQGHLDCQESGTTIKYAHIQQAEKPGHSVRELAKNKGLLKSGAPRTPQVAPVKLMLPSASLLIAAEKKAIFTEQLQVVPRVPGPRTDPLGYLP